MSVTANILPYLRHNTEGKSRIEVEGRTVAQCLNALIEHFPGLRTVLFDEGGNLLDYVDVYVNGESSYYKGQDMQVEDGDELHIILLIEGG